MSKKFYTHLISYESILVELDSMDLSDNEKAHLSKLIDSSLHHTVLDAIFDQLSPEDKDLFIEHLQTEDYEKVWGFLNGKVDNIEDRIKSAAEDLKKQMHKDIKEAKTLKGK